MVRQQLYKNDYVGQKIPIEPIIVCAANLTTNDDEMPLAASQGVVLEERKLNKTFPDGEPNQVLALDAFKEAKPVDFSGLFVDLINDQTIDGIKTFNETINVQGLFFGTRDDNLNMTFNDTVGGSIILMKGGQPDGELTVMGKRFSDPYDATNDLDGTKDKKIKELDDRVIQAEQDIKSKSQVLPGKTEVPGAEAILSVSIDGTYFNLNKNIEGSKNRIEGGTDLKALKIGSENWNIATYDPDEHYFEGQPTAKSLMYGNQIWNLPGAQAVQLYPTQPGTPKYITGLLQSSQKIGNIVILHVYFTIPAGKAGQEVILQGLPEPYEVDFHTGTPECYLVVSGTDLMVIIPNAATQSRVFGMNIVYAVR